MVVQNPEVQARVRFEQDAFQSHLNNTHNRHVVGVALLLAIACVLIGCSAKPPRTSAREAVVPRVSNASLRETPQGDLPSGRLLAVQKFEDRRKSTNEFRGEEFGISLDAPKGYLVREGELSKMDTGLGYLGPIPMHFAQKDGIRVVTIEAPRSAHIGTDFVNAFVTVSVLYSVDEGHCGYFNVDEAQRQVPVTRKISGIVFNGFTESEAASLHQYSGTYLHGFANDTCYEVGYGMATAGYGAMDGLKKVNEGTVAQKLEKIVETITINPPEFEREVAQ